jgi:hypothetical protein
VFCVLPPPRTPTEQRVPRAYFIGKDRARRFGGLVFANLSATLYRFNA